MSNPYVNFLNLLPKQVKFIAKIISVNTTNGTALVEKVGGNDNILIKGGSDTFGINDYVLVVDNVITSKLDNIQTILEEEVI